MNLKPALRVIGRVGLPGDKSISHRAAMIAAVARGRSRLQNFSTSRDCSSTLTCLKHLGVSVDQQGKTILIEGRGESAFAAPKAALDCGNSGSTMRMLAGLLAGQGFTSELIGDESLSARPMQRIIEPLELMGAQVRSNKGKPPLTIKGIKPLHSIRYVLPVASAQVKTCVLFGGLLAQGSTTIIERNGVTRDHTERMLARFGAPVDVKTTVDGSKNISITGQSTFDGCDIRVPGDLSSGGFLIAAAAMLPGSNLTLDSVGLNPSRTQFLAVLQLLGATITRSDLNDFGNEPVGTIVVSGGMNFPDDCKGPRKILGKDIPQLIDELPLLAVVGTQVAGGIEIRDAAELRVKESDRLAATVRNLRAMGAEVEEYDDGIAVCGPVRLRGAVLHSDADHRIALAFAVAALIAEGESVLEGAECVAVSFPEFFELLETLVVR